MAKEIKVFKGKEYDVRMDISGGNNVDKYIMVDNKIISLRDVIKEEKKGKFQRLGKFDVVLAEKYSGLKDDKFYDVVISFDYSDEGFEDVQKSQEMISRMNNKKEDIRANSINTIKQILKLDDKQWGVRNPTLKSNNKISLKLTKNNLEKIKYLENI